MVSVLIPTISNKYLSGLLPDLEKEVNAVNGEIIITDNSSGQHLPYSFAKSNNLMVESAKNEYVLLLNDDTQINKGFLQSMLDTFCQPKIAVVGCLIYSMQGQIIHTGVYYNQDKWPYEEQSHQSATSIKEVPSVTGACMMVKKSVWQELGGMNEQFINGWEDNDFNLRIREKGYKIFYNGEASIRHVLHGSIDEGRLQREEYNVQLFRRIWIDTGRINNLV